MVVSNRTCIGKTTGNFQPTQKGPPTPCCSRRRLVSRFNRTPLFSGRLGVVCSARISRPLEQFFFSDDDIHGDIIGKDRKSLDHLQGEGQADSAGLSGGSGEKAVIIAASVSKAISLSIKNRAGHHHYFNGFQGQQSAGDQGRKRLGNALVAGGQIRVWIGDRNGCHPRLVGPGQGHADRLSRPQTTADQFRCFDLAVIVAVDEQVVCVAENGQGEQSLDDLQAQPRSCHGRKKTPLSKKTAPQCLSIKCLGGAHR